MTDDGYDVFLSCAGPDRPRVRRLYRALGRAGLVELTHAIALRLRRLPRRLAIGSKLIEAVDGIDGIQKA